MWLRNVVKVKTSTVAKVIRAQAKSCWTQAKNKNAREPYLEAKSSK